MRVFVEQYNPKSPYNLCYLEVDNILDNDFLHYVDITSAEMFTNAKNEHFIGKNFKPVKFEIPDKELLCWFENEAQYGKCFDYPKENTLIIPDETCKKYGRTYNDLVVLIDYLSITLKKGNWYMASEENYAQDTDTGVIYNKTKKQLDFITTEDGQCLEKILSCETYDVAKTRKGYICVSNAEGSEFVSEEFKELENHSGFKELKQAKSKIPDTLVLNIYEYEAEKPLQIIPTQEINELGKNSYIEKLNGVLDYRLMWEHWLNGCTISEIESIRNQYNLSNLLELSEDTITELQNAIGFEWEEFIYKPIINFYQVTEEDYKTLQEQGEVTFQAYNSYIWGKTD